MKHTKRKLLSLLLALAVMCSMMSAGLAAVSPYYGYYSDYSGYQAVGVQSGGSKNINASFPEYVMTSLGYAKLGGIEWNGGDSNITVSGSGASATVSAASGSSNYSTAQATATAYYYLVDFPYVGVADTATFYYNITVGGTDGTPIINNGYNASYNPGYVPDYGSASGSSYVTALSQGSMSLGIGSVGPLTVSSYLSSNRVNISSVTWGSGNPAIATVSGYSTSASVTGVSAGQTTIYATVKGTYYNGSSYQDFTNVLGCTVTVGTGVSSYDLYISPSTLQVNVGSSDVLTASSYTSSIQSQLSNVTWTSSDSSVASVNYYDSATGSSVYVYGQSAGVATITATLYANSQTYTASCNVVVGSDTGVDVLYTTTPGTSLTMKTADFQKFWTDSNPYGTLNYVVFGSTSGSVGSLKYTTSSNLQASAIGRQFYVSPTYLQDGIDEVTFVPTTYTSSYNYTGTLVVPFTAYGTTGYNSYATTSLSGRMYIMVVNGTVSDINYQFSSTGVKLASADFTNVYKSAVTNASAYPSFYIQFLDVPAFGTLYYNYYAGSSYIQSYGTKLTNANISSLYFGNTASGVYSIDSLTYVPSSTNIGDTVRYIAYSSAYGGTPLYMGEINFGKGAGTANLVKYISAVNKTVSFDDNNFLADNSYYARYISFGTPSSGTLYKNAGTYVTASDVFVAGTGATQTNSLDNVYFVPKTGFTGVVEIPYTASSLTGSQISGTVKLYYSNVFPDVKPDWAYDYIMQMSAEGIVTGKPGGLFDPNGKVTYGEALKMIMEATGYSSTNATTGHWANNYLTKAYREGLVATTNIDLNKEIDRDAVAAIAAKALDLKAVTSTATSPFADSKDGYVLALYNAGIIEGSTVGTNRYYYGSNDISRKEISKIICLISDYNG